jgi:hypothetical protein
MINVQIREKCRGVILSCQLNTVLGILAKTIKKEYEAKESTLETSISKLFLLIYDMNIYIGYL